MLRYSVMLDTDRNILTRPNPDSKWSNPTRPTK